MHNIVTVTSAASVTALTTLQTVKAELNITNTASDDILRRKIDEATSDIEAHLSRTLRRETVTETFWGDDGYAEYLILERYPIASITSITVDDVEVDSDEYRYDANSGLVYRLDASGYPCVWVWCKSIVIVYAAGFLLPGESGRNLPPAIESAAISLVSSYWQSRGRDSTVKEEEVPGVMRISYWVGYIGEAGQLPPDVITKIAPFRRSRL